MNEPTPERIAQLARMDELAAATIKHAVTTYGKAGPADTAQQDSSSPRSQETAKTDTSVPELEVLFHRDLDEYNMVFGEGPWVTMSLHDGGVKVEGGGISGASSDVMEKFFAGMGDVLHEIAIKIREESP